MATSQALREAIATAIAPYRQLLVAFAEGRMSATDFEAAYLDVYLHDDSEFSDAVFPVVDRFFAEVDSFVADPVLRQRVIQGIGADELRQCARGLLASAGYEHVRSG